MKYRLNVDVVRKKERGCCYCVGLFFYSPAWNSLLKPYSRAPFHPTFFCCQVLFTGGSCTRTTLVGDAGGELVTALAWPLGEVVWVGMLMSTLGAGLQSLAGAPRLLAAIGRDGLIPEFRVFAPTPGAEPRLAVAFCAALSLGAVMLGDLNAVAPFITMWFLTCYGGGNKREGEGGYFVCTLVLMLLCF
jgi:amino acid transporter